MKIIAALVKGVTCVGAVFALTTTIVHAQNVLVDPGFENGAGWSTFNGAAYSMDFARSGSWSMKQVTQNNVPGAFQQFPAAPGDLWTMTGYGYTPTELLGQPFGGASFGGLQITFFNAANQDIGTVETSPGVALFSNQINQTSPASQWISLLVAAHAPAGTVYGQAFAITIDFSSPEPEGIYYDDLDLRITAVPEPSALAFLALGLGLPLLVRRRD